jgi:phosphoglycerate dehydrogenase-like enzyme
VPFVDQAVGPSELRSILPEADYVAVAAPLTAATEGMLGPPEFAAMKRGVIYINVSRGAVAQEQALLSALQAGHVAAAGLDVFAVEPLAPDHPLWTMPQVLVSPHYSGETVNQSSLPAERFTRNLRSWLAGRDLEGLVKLDLGY